MLLAIAGQGLPDVPGDCSRGVLRPWQLISFSSECENLSGLRSELCRLPIKPNPNGFELYTKAEMRNKFKVRSPNLADCVMMTENESYRMNAAEPDYSNYQIPCGVG